MLSSGIDPRISSLNGRNDMIDMFHAVQNKARPVRRMWFERTIPGTVMPYT